MEKTAVELSTLLDPVTEKEFLADYFDVKHLYVQGPPERFSEIFSWDEFNRLMNMGGIWSDKTMKLVLQGTLVEPEQYCASDYDRDGRETMIPNPNRVIEFARQGATIVLNHQETLSSGISSVEIALQKAFGAPSSCNAYCSFREKPGFGPHFDTMDVFVLHISGQKRWNIYEGRFDLAVDTPGFNGGSFPQEYHDQACGKVAEELIMSPGDFLYVPKGLYHAALAHDDACLHLSFGMTRPLGWNLVQLLAQDLPKHSLFREPLPHFDDAGAHQKHLKKLADALQEIVASPGTSTNMRNYQRSRANRDAAPDFSFPGTTHQTSYRVADGEAKIIRRGQQWLLKLSTETAEIDADCMEVAKWALQRSDFSQAAVTDAFKDKGPEILGNVLKELEETGILQRD
ncbi:MAG: hypothetical protein ISR48_04855 [Alphaproteobacteria bacterium]|nr:hypothetical protein [Alphaproteobacteria bacterium]